MHLAVVVAAVGFAPHSTVRIARVPRIRVPRVLVCGSVHGPGSETDNGAGLERARRDEDSRGIGAAVLASSTLAAAMIALVVASTLGMEIGSNDNYGLGVPLSTEESRKLKAKAGVVTSAADEEARLSRGLTEEEAREEEALVRILRSEPLRAR